MRTSWIRAIPLGLLSISPLSAQVTPSAAAPFAERLGYLVGQAAAGFKDLRADSIGAGAWRVRYVMAEGLDSTVALASSSVTELERQHADGRPGKAVVGVFALALAPPGDSTSYTRFRQAITAALPTWPVASQGGGGWTECPDPRRGREAVLSTGNTVSGEVLLILSITLHPDPACG
jgi:hypothetical protein